MDRSGWAPSRFSGRGAATCVNWCWLGSERFGEPFFDSTMDRAMARPFNALFAHRTPVTELEEWYTRSPGIRPTGFIFHMSRCGSTLVSRMLAAVPENLVISEAQPLDRLARAAWLSEGTRSEWLRWMASALGQRRAGGETRFFVKFDSATTAAIPAIRAAFPDVPWMFLYRNPVEVLVSHLRRPAAAMAPGVITEEEASRFVDSAMTHEEYAARALGALCSRAVHCHGGGGGLLVNYAELPGAVGDSIARHFGFTWSPRDWDLMKKAAERDSKASGRLFLPDTEEKRREVSDAVRAAAARWIEPSYSELEQLRRMK